MSRGGAAAFLWAGLLALASPARAVVIAPQPGHSVTVLEEDVFLVFDPLTSSQTLLVQFEVEGTARPFGLLVPTPKAAAVSPVSERVRRSLASVLHPRAQKQRILDVEYYSWAASCAVREVGDLVDVEDADNRVPTASAESAPIGSAPEPLHDWLLREGFTLAPAQVAWLAELRARGWSVVGVTVRPTVTEGAPPSRLRTPVISLTHEAEEPIYAAGIPPFALTGSAVPGMPDVELAVLTEWAVGVDSETSPEPFFADAVAGRDVLRLSGDAGGNPWNFRRDGTLTAFRLVRPTGLGVVRFARTPPRPTIHPAPRHELKTHRLRVPVEALLLFLGGLGWTWMRYARRGGPQAKVVFRA